MNPFSESFQKELGKGIAQLLLGVATVLLLVVAGLLQGDRHTASTVLLYLAIASSLALCVSLVFRLFSYQKIHRRILDLESRVAASEAKKVVEMQEIEKKIEAAANKPAVWC